LALEFRLCISGETPQGRTTETNAPVLAPLAVGSGAIKLVNMHRLGIDAKALLVGCNRLR